MITKADYGIMKALERDWYDAHGNYDGLDTIAAAIAEYERAQEGK